MDPNYNSQNPNYFQGMPYADKNPAMPYINKAMGEVKGYYDPYTNNAANPEFNIDRIAANFKKSPAFNQAYDDRARAHEAAAAASGRINNPSFGREMGDLASSFYTDEMRKYIQDVMGQQGLGLQAAGMASGDVSNLYGQGGNLAFQQDTQERKNQQDIMRSIINALGTAGGAALGGAPGAVGGKSLSDILYKMFGGGSSPEPEQGYGFNNPMYSNLNSSYNTKWMDF